MINIIRISVSVILLIGGLLLVPTTTVMGACHAVPTFADNLKPTNHLPVAVNGSDINGDGSPGSPFATITHAARQATAGTAVVVHSGIYPGGIYLDGIRGTAAAPIWIGGAAGELRPVIEGGGEGIHVSHGTYLVLHDLEVRNAAQNGINVDDGGDYSNPLAAHHILFERLYIHDIGGSGNQDGLKLSGINDFMVRDSEIMRCGGGISGSGIDLVGCHRGIIAGCTFEDMSGNAIQCKGGSEDIDIRWNRIRNAGQRGVNLGGSTGFQYFRPPLSTETPNVEARNIRVLSNIFEGTVTPVAFVGCIDSVVANNTIIDPDRWIFRILQETVTTGSYEFLPCGDNRFGNNLVYFDRSQLSTYVNIGPNTDPASFVFTNNLWFAHDNPSSSTPGLPSPESDGIYSHDPLLNDPSTGDYRIGPESPAVGTGLSPALLEGDIAGSCYRLPPSIGAYEYVNPCQGDSEPDGDVDGIDIWKIIIKVGQSETSVSELAADFGRMNCL